VVVSACSKRRDGVLLRVVSGIQQDGRGVARGSKPSADLPTVHARHPCIEQHEVRGPPERNLEPTRAIVADANFEPRTLQGACHTLRETDLVVYQQQLGLC
jgi:hypothetical protein